MHDAFEYASILERLPLVIESIASYGKESNLTVHLIVAKTTINLFVYFRFN